MRLIDADALIECLQTWKTVAVSEGLPINERFAMAMIAQVNLMPTIEPERKKGKWTLLPNGNAICQECKHVQKSAWDMDGWDNFCHHCGADMSEPEDIPMEYYESGGR